MVVHYNRSVKKDRNKVSHSRRLKNKSRRKSRRKYLGGMEGGGTAGPGVNQWGTDEAMGTGGRTALNSIDAAGFESLEPIRDRLTAEAENAAANPGTHMDPTVLRWLETHSPKSTSYDYQGTKPSYPDATVSYQDNIPLGATAAEVDDILSNSSVTSSVLSDQEQWPRLGRKRIHLDLLGRTKPSDSGGGGDRSGFTVSLNSDKPPLYLTLESEPTLRFGGGGSGSSSMSQDMIDAMLRQKESQHQGMLVVKRDIAEAQKDGKSFEDFKVDYRPEGNADTLKELWSQVSVQTHDRSVARDRLLPDQVLPSPDVTGRRSRSTYGGDLRK